MFSLGSVVSPSCSHFSSITFFLFIFLFLWPVYSILSLFFFPLFFYFVISLFCLQSSIRFFSFTLSYLFCFPSPLSPFLPSVYQSPFVLAFYSFSSFAPFAFSFHSFFYPLFSTLNSQYLFHTPHFLTLFPSTFFPPSLIPSLSSSLLPFLSPLFLPLSTFTSFPTFLSHSKCWHYAQIENAHKSISSSFLLLAPSFLLCLVRLQQT